MAMLKAAVALQAVPLNEAEFLCYFLSFILGNSVVSETFGLLMLIFI